MVFKNDRQRRAVMSKLSKTQIPTKYKSIDDLPDVADIVTIDDIFDKPKSPSMTVQEAKDYMGDRPIW